MLHWLAEQTGVPFLYVCYLTIAFLGWGLGSGATEIKHIRANHRARLRAEVLVAAGRLTQAEADEILAGKQATSTRV